MVNFESTSIRSFDEGTETTAFWSSYDETSSALNCGRAVRDIRIVNDFSKSADEAGEPLSQSDFQQLSAGIEAAKADFARGVRV